ncbi:peptidyl-prolyl cis-trans isomerase FKBP3-like isoform X1 [Stigmatopora argus]
MSQESVRESTAKQRRIDDLPKKDLIKLSQDNAGHSVLNEHRLLGNIKNVAKKEQLVDTISSCLSAKGFQATEMVEEVTRVHPSLPNECDKTNFPKKSYTKLWYLIYYFHVLCTKPTHFVSCFSSGSIQVYQMNVTRQTSPKRVTPSCGYMGMLEDGTVFDTLRVSNSGPGGALSSMFSIPPPHLNQMIKILII